MDNGTRLLCSNGGICSDLSDEPYYLHPSESTKLAFSGHALLFLAENIPGVILDMPVSEIMDKSKASGLAKTIVCLEAFMVLHPGNHSISSASVD